MTTGSVRGAGTARAGATDTTMLIWKVIAASPGITRQTIWERIEHDIPPGYARRRWERVAKAKIGADDAATILRARSYVLSDLLQSMRAGGVIVSDGAGRGRRFSAVRQPKYFGNPDVVDETGTKAAEHMALADALRITEKVIARRRPGVRPMVCLSNKECDALALIARALRAKNG